ncbi:MAG: CDP-diacylglycerol--serine O-phosphatidyltransferase [Eubacteriales bacterium]|jgi:CDP-diacylglycerol--serine O-phosphatidyltransferase|nr:CDP-diacylglycerol--serine O-phosphatidyltransferase [Eubacteriales bacterium]MDD4327070.1 CDP-diacylglycerol--serine O-phosphatidyltransferase [Eubacteriales bacterium]MDD4716731.1 CDP-diacylglycerol--serine O-phosphatidyltransferase [Eubacteriales bacterium]NCU26363.1 CDP-diacylglycerol--serine O-phosphatidyltransferase [Candidatus Nomurabacteria bacterium]
MKKISRSVWPNLITLSNLTLGMAAILIVSTPSATNDLMFVASFMVAIAALTDRFDGKVARRLDAVSELGKELDSLADLVSFGIAPVVIAWRTGLVTLGWIGMLVCIVYPLCGAFRLARFNSSKFDDIFMGMPITIAGAFMALINILNCFLLAREKLSPVNGIITAVLTVILSYLMISRIRIRKR